MAQGDQGAPPGIIRSISKRLDWDASPASEGAVRLTLRQSDGEAKMAISRERLDLASEGGTPLYQLRERVKKTRKRIHDAIRSRTCRGGSRSDEPISAPGPGLVGGGGRRRRSARIGALTPRTSTDN
jgi:hypothetical protein